VTTTDTTTRDRIIECLEAADYPALVDLFAPDALLDMNLPTWRFQHQGTDEIRAYLEAQTTGMPNLHCTYIRDISTDDAVVVESECRFDGDGGEYLWRAVDIFTLAGGKVTNHSQYCTGCSTPQDIARQRVEAPMVRW
jgi:ketosteroid isomerase-like protein